MFISKYLNNKMPSIIRLTQAKFDKRNDGTQAINIAIGNVSLPMHPAMRKRMFELNSLGSPFKNGIVKYSSSEGFKESQKSFLNIISSSGFDVDNLHVQITDGASLGIELCVLGLSGKNNSNRNSILIFDPIYTTYKYMAERLGRSIISMPRSLNRNNKFIMPSINLIEKQIKKYSPSALLVIPYDNPTGQYYTKKQMIELAKLCVKYNMWLISDEAYRELYYAKGKPTSVWGITDSVVPGIHGKRVSIESASKVWNACGLRIGAIVSDNADFIKKIQAEYTIYVCPNVIGQYIFGALANEKKENLKKWYSKQRKYYSKIILNTSESIIKNIQGIVVTKPEAAMYFIVDFNNITGDSFTAYDFSMYCAEKGSVKIGSKNYTLLMSPISPFYKDAVSKNSKAQKQIRISCVENEKNMKKVPVILEHLFFQYIKKTKKI